MRSIGGSHRASQTFMVSERVPFLDLPSTMTPDELKALEEKLKERADDLDAREAALSGKSIAGNTTSPTSPPASTYVASIKTLVPITLDLQDPNYTKWRELILAALGRYGQIGRAHV